MTTAPADKTLVPNQNLAEDEMIYAKLPVPSPAAGNGSQVAAL